MGSSEQTELTTGLDWSTDDISPEEGKALEAWYSSTHGTGDLEFSRFLPFMLENRPAALKHYRRWVETIPGGLGLEARERIPEAAMGMLFLHLYITARYTEGVMYEAIACRTWGATKAQVQEIFALAWLNGGTSAINVAAKQADGYMKDWQDDDVAQGGITWPDGWVPDVEAFRAGLDYSTLEVSAEERERLEEWHIQWQGEVPQHVGFLAKHYPAALKLFRRRYETAVSGALPKQFVPLLQLHLSLIQQRSRAARRAAVHAERLGASRAQILHVAATSQLYLGESGMDILAEALEEFLEQPSGAS